MGGYGWVRVGTGKYGWVRLGMGGNMWVRVGTGGFSGMVLHLIAKTHVPAHVEDTVHRRLVADLALVGPALGPPLDTPRSL